MCVYKAIFKLINSYLILIKKKFQLADNFKK